MSHGPRQDDGVMNRVIRQHDIYVALAVILFGALGLLDIAYGHWREGPAIGPHAFPQLAYIVLIAAGIGIIVDVVMRGGDPPNPEARDILLTGMAVSAIGFAMFLLANRLGFATAVALTLIAAAFILIPNPLKAWKTTIIIPLLATAVMYALFVMLIGIPLSRGILI